MQFMSKRNFHFETEGVLLITLKMYTMRSAPGQLWVLNMLFVSHFQLPEGSFDAIKALNFI